MYKRQSEDGALEMARACCAHVRVVGGLVFRKMRALALEMLCPRSRGIGMGEVAEMTDIVRLGSVSYTHLDVYKRQQMTRHFPKSIQAPCRVASTIESRHVCGAD